MTKSDDRVLVQPETSIDDTAHHEKDLVLRLRNRRTVKTAIRAGFMGCRAYTVYPSYPV